MLSMLFFFSLLFTMKAGQVQVGSQELESSISSILWCGAKIVFTKDDEAVEQEHKETKKTLFSLTDQGKIWKSIDYGLNWIKEQDQFEAITGFSLEFESMQISPADSRVIFLFGSNGVSYRSRNCGKSYEKFTHNNELYDFKMNKMDDKWIMAFQDIQCNRKDLNCKDYYKKQIWASKDSGDTWNLVLNYVREAAWDKLLQYQIVPDERIIACHMKEGVSVLSFSDDYYQTTETLAENIHGFFQTNFYIFSLSKDITQEGYKLLVSAAYLDKFQPQEITLPLSQMNQHSFTILDTSEGQIFVSVSHNEENQKLTNIYISDFRGFKFTISLLHNVRSLDTGNCDFERILGMDGVYIANIYDHTEVEKQKRREFREFSTTQPLENYKKTLISYDKGGAWHQLNAPTVDSEGNHLYCSGDCSLHLKGRTEANQNPIYSSDNSPGIAMGVGNVGLYLTQKDHEVNTYLTRDGGHTWEEVKKGSHMYEIGDRGGLIVMGRDDKPTDTIIYSWDEGLTWEEIKLPDEIEIQNIVTEPSNMEQKFVIYGTKVNQKNGFVIGMNFQTLHQRVCSGIWDPSASESDYEFWMPRNFENNKCIFGRKMKYIRRKREAKCFNQEESDKRFFIEICECTYDDWECDFGFYRKIDGGPCVPISEDFEDEYPDILLPPKECKQTWMKSQGYRKVSGDYCHGGVDLGPLETPCPAQEKKNMEESEPIRPRRTERENVKENKKEQKQNEKGGENRYLWIIILILGGAIVYLIFKDRIPRFDQGEKKKGQGKQLKGINRTNYEQLSLFQNEEEDET